MPQLYLLSVFIYLAYGRGSMEPSSHGEGAEALGLAARAQCMLAIIGIAPCPPRKMSYR